MAYSGTGLKSPRSLHQTKSPSPLRHASTISDSEDDEDTFRSRFTSPSRANTYTTNSQYGLPQNSPVHKRGVSDLTTSKPYTSYDNSTNMTSTNSPRKPQPVTRQTLGEMPQATNVRAGPVPDLKPGSVHNRAQSLDAAMLTARPSMRKDPSPTQPEHPTTNSTNRITMKYDTGQEQHTYQAPVLDDSDLKRLGTSATSHLRTLSKLAENGTDKEFAIRTKAEEVTGLHGRRKLQGNMSTQERPLKTPGYGGRIWLDQQRQYLQAYEYLCHIGEAKEWIQDVMGKDIPAIVQLEEHLRDGVTLAELVQTLRPGKAFRIFRHQKLQYRHSDNIAIFFNFLADVELPETFRFELVDLYEKKNIPKVIYCIHALSWLLFRKGILNFKIGNLVGQLEFEQHELEDMQKGLDQSGVSMPNFSGLRPEPVEPVETEQDRIDRELSERRDSIVDFQAQLRGALLRLQLGEMMQIFWANEDWLLDLQARVRGDWSRQVHGYQLQMRGFAVKLQSISRGYLIRAEGKQRTQDWKVNEKSILRLQAMIRAQKTRNQTRLLKSGTQKHEHGIREVQAAIRGALKRLQLGEQHAHASDAHHEVVSLQKHIRGFLSRQKHHQHAHTLEGLEPVWTALQSLARGYLARSAQRGRHMEVKKSIPAVIALQTQIRKHQAQITFSKQRAELADREAVFTKLQSSIRAHLLNKARNQDRQQIELHVGAIIEVQAAARGWILCQQVERLLVQLEEHYDGISEVQAAIRGRNVRLQLEDKLVALADAEEEIVELQALVRGRLIRKQFQEKQRHFKENMEKVVKIQSFIRGRQQGQAYKSLTSGKNPPVGTVKNFVHLLNDSDFDFDEEIESEKLQQQLVGQIQNIEKLETWITEMDAKIGLLAHNKIASDEAARLRHLPTSSHRGTPSKDSFNSRTLNKNSRAKLERYQELFFILQTQPQYLARLFKTLRERGSVEADQKRMESLVMSTFAHAQKQREEYYLLKLLARSIQEEMDACSTPLEFARGSFFFARLFGVYTRVPRDRKFIRQTFGQLIKMNIVEDEQLNLESDPQFIYRAVLNDEELRTGRITRDPNMPKDLAIQEPDVRAIFVDNLQAIRNLVDLFVFAFEDAIPRIPYGTRFMAKQLFDTLCARYPRDDQRQLLMDVGFWLWKTYVKPAFADPEGQGLIDRGLDSTDKRNLNILTTVLNQYMTAKPFSTTDLFYFQPLNKHLFDDIRLRLEAIWTQVINIPDAETKFDIGQFNDFYAKVKPILYIKMTDVFTLHRMVADNVTSLCRSQEDTILRDVLRELGSPKANEVEMSAGQAEVTLSLGGRMHAVEDPDAEVKALFMETKRCVLYIIRIQTGPDLMSIMVKPCTPDDEARWATLVHEELTEAANDHSRRRSAYTDNGTTNLIDITSLNYASLKAIALENILELERHQRLTRQNHYQDLLNEIAVDIRNKHRRRVQRQQELENVRNTLSHLEEKQKYLQDRLDAYNNTYEQSLTTLQSKSARRNGLKKLTNPFSKQATHMRSLKSRGEEPRFGSYKYSGQQLLQRGILLSWEGRNLKEDDITVSSNHINDYDIEGSRGHMNIPGAAAKFTWDDLLDAEYEGQEVIEFFGDSDKGVDELSMRKSMDVRRGKSMDMGPRAGVLRLDRRAFVELLSKKFWREAS